MFHIETERLIARWKTLPGVSRIPHRHDFDPMTLGSGVSRLVLLQLHHGHGRIRLAGDWIEHLYERPLGGRAWSDLWEAASAALAERALRQAVDEIRPVVLAAECPRLPGGLEIPLLPFRGPDGRADRLVGLYRPQGSTRPFLRTTARMSVNGILTVGDPSEHRPRLVALQGRRLA